MKKLAWSIFILFSLVNFESTYGRSPAVFDFVEIGPEQEGRKIVQQDFPNHYNFSKKPQSNSRPKVTRKISSIDKPSNANPTFGASVLLLLALLVLLPSVLWQLVMAKLHHPREKNKKSNPKYPKAS